MKKSERTVQKVEHAQGGEGYILKDALLTPQQMGEHCTMLAEIVLEPGCEVGLHQHNGTTETYYILEGGGMYTDDGKQYPVKAGDVTFCDNGHFHALKNIGDKNLVMIALILKKEA